MSLLCESAAAYVLGALPAAERAEFESHLATCQDCRRTVAELAGLPGLLSRVDPDDLADPPPLPDTLVPGLLRAVRRTARRRRLVTVGAAAAAVLVAVLGTFAIVRDGGDTPPPGAAMSAVVDSPIRATAALEERDWGTVIALECQYDVGSEPSAYKPYVLVVVDEDGHDHEVATWTVGPGREASVSGSVGLQPTEIDRLEVRTDAGEALLRLTP